MDKTTKTKPKRKGFLSLLKESMTKSSEGCGPGCGCHAEDKNAKKKANDPDAAKDTKKP